MLQIEKTEEGQVMSNLPSLPDEIKNIPWFGELTPAQVELLAGIAAIQEYQPGEEVFHEGDREDFIYVILSGCVQLENYIPSLGNQPMVLAEPLDVIGWSCLTPVVRQRVATAAVCKPTRLLKIRGTALAQACDEDHDLGYVVMRRVANIVATQYLTTRLHLYDVIRNTTHSLAQSNLY
jgi:CRP/FNR family transcriptional regulator, cyclic AMP receptor protein